MLHRRKFLATATGAALAAPGLVRAQSPISIKLSVTPTIFPELFDELVKGFEGANPGIKVVVEGRHRSQELQFQDTLRRGLVGDLPDVSFQGFAYIPVLRENGYIVSVQQRLAGETRAAELGLSDSVVGPNRVNGELYGLSVGMSYPVIYVNTTLAERVGYTESSLPADWSGVLEMGARIAALGGDTQGAFFQYASGDNWTWVALVQSLGGEILKSGGREVAFAGSEGKRSLEILRAFGEIGQARYDTSQDQSRRVFSSGIMGVLYDSSSSLANFERTAGDRFKIRTIPLPVASGGVISAQGIATVMHTKDPRRQEAAWRFMTFASGIKGQELVGKLTGYVPANRVAVETPDVLGRYYAERPGMSAAIRSSAFAAPAFAFPGDNGQKAHLEVREHLGRVATLKATPEEGLAAIERTVRTLVLGARR